MEGLNKETCLGLFACCLRDIDGCFVWLCVEKLLFVDFVLMNMI